MNRLSSSRAGGFHVRGRAGALGSVEGACTSESLRWVRPGRWEIKKWMSADMIETGNFKIVLIWFSTSLYIFLFCFSTFQSFWSIPSEDLLYWKMTMWHICTLYSLFTFFFPPHSGMPQNFIPSQAFFLFSSLALLWGFSLFRILHAFHPTGGFTITVS